MPLSSRENLRGYSTSTSCPRTSTLKKKPAGYSFMEGEEDVGKENRPPVRTHGMVTRSLLRLAQKRCITAPSKDQDKPKDIKDRPDSKYQSMARYPPPPIIKPIARYPPPQLIKPIARYPHEISGYKRDPSCGEKRKRQDDPRDSGGVKKQKK
ncbi:hypothetical protein BC941DRAFT_454277 [Chlamydoabsidia padenii]|nr:hypothetical protein BC941DRAFT_454277 [Chlamydoabsidia padenii]